MSRPGLLATVCSLIGLVTCGSADAGEIIQHVVGIVSVDGSSDSNMDTYGLFGPVGGDLNGQQITLFYSYNSSLFGIPNNNYPCSQTLTAANLNKNLPGSALLVVTINGKTVTIVPSYEAQVEFCNNVHGYTFSVSPEISGTYFSGGVFVNYTNQINFGAELAPRNPVDLSHFGSVYFVPPSGQVEGLSFKILRAAR